MFVTESQQPVSIQAASWFLSPKMSWSEPFVSNNLVFSLTDADCIMKKIKGQIAASSCMLLVSHAMFELHIEPEIGIGSKG